MKKLNIFAVLALVGSSTICSAQVMSNSTKANPSTQGYGTSGAILKDQNSKVKKDKAASTQQAPGNSAAETAGAATPNDISRPVAGESAGR